MNEHQCKQALKETCTQTLTLKKLLLANNFCWKPNSNYHSISPTPLQTINQHKHVVISGFNHFLWTKMYLSPFKRPRSRPFCPYPPWCVLNQVNCSSGWAPASVDGVYMGQRGIFWKQGDRNTAQRETNAAYKAGSILLNAWPEQTDIQRKSSKCKYCCTCSITFVPL